MSDAGRDDMSGPKGVQYSVAQVAAMAEARALAEQKSRLRMLRADAEAFAQECALVEAHYREGVAVPRASRVGGADSAAVRRVADELAAALVIAREQLDEVRVRRRRERLATRLADLAPIEVPDHPRASDQPSASATAERPREVAHDRASLSARVDEVLARLDPEAELSERFISLVALLAQADPQVAEQSYRSVEEEVARVNREQRRRRRIGSVLAELDVRAGALDDPRASSAVADARTRGEALTEDELERVRSFVETAETAEHERAAQAYVATSISQILEGLGYEVMSGFDTAVAEHGVLVRRPGWRQHGLRVAVDGEEIGFDVVRVEGEADSARAQSRDTEVETQWCADLPAILTAAEGRGIRPGGIRRIDAGVVPVRLIAADRPQQEKRTRTKRAVPKEQTL